MALSTEEISPRKNLLDWAWAIIANAGGGDWEKEPKEWREAATKWCDAYHEYLSRK